jgi:hypothetical protein
LSTILIDPKVIADQARDELLAADPTFATIPVISGDPGDITTAIDAALEMLAIGVFILPVSMKSTVPNAAVRQPGSTQRYGPFFDKIKLSALIIENPTLNRNGTDFVTAQNLTMLVAGILHWFAPAGINERFLVTDVVPVPTPRPDADNQPTLNIWYVEMTAGGGIGYNKGTVAPVLFTYADGAVTLTCATPGAAIFYVIGSQGYPSPSNPNASLVLLLSSGVLLDEDGAPLLNEGGSLLMNEAGPVFASVPLAAGQTITARAWLSGLNAATPDTQTFTAP